MNENLMIFALELEERYGDSGSFLFKAFILRKIKEGKIKIFMNSSSDKQRASIAIEDPRWLEPDLRFLANVFYRVERAHRTYPTQVHFDYRLEDWDHVRYICKAGEFSLRFDFDF